MSIVEKAAEKLRTLQPEPEQLARVAPESPEPASTVERLQERKRTVDSLAEAKPSWHLEVAALRRLGLVSAEDGENSRLMDELRRVKRPLLDNVIGKRTKALLRGKRIAVTSAVPADGKTFTAVNLALSVAREPDFEVLLVDGDIPNSDITRALGLGDYPGLMDVLADEQRDPAEIVIATDVPNLLVVPAGGRTPIATELLGGRRMEHVLDALGGQGRERVLVFDSPPLLATAEAPVLVSHMGQVVVVVAAGHTRQQDVASALEALDGSQYVGLVLNMSRGPSGGDRYYGYYGPYSKDH